MPLFETPRDRQDAVSAVAMLCRPGGWETERRIAECCELLSGRVLPVAVGLRAMGAESAPGGWWRVRCDIPSERDALKWQAERQAISI